MQKEGVMIEDALCPGDGGEGLTPIIASHNLRELEKAYEGI